MQENPEEQAENPKSTKIRDLNDIFRLSMLGRVLVTRGIQALGNHALLAILEKVRSFQEFTPDNDPYGEHDFGSLNYQGQKIFWKIDYYNKDLSAGSPEPSDPAQTTRVLTIMLAEEY